LLSLLFTFFSYKLLRMYLAVEDKHEWILLHFVYHLDTGENIFRVDSSVEFDTALDFDNDAPASFLHFVWFRQYAPSLSSAVKIITRIYSFLKTK